MKVMFFTSISYVNIYIYIQLSETICMVLVVLQISIIIYLTIAITHLIFKQRRLI